MFSGSTANIALITHAHHMISNPKHWELYIRGGSCHQPVRFQSSFPIEQEIYCRAACRFSAGGRWRELDDDAQGDAAQSALGTKPATGSPKIFFGLPFGCVQLTFVHFAPRCSRSGSEGCFELLASQILPMLR